MPGYRNRKAEVAVIRPAQPRSTAAAVSGATERRLAGAMEVPIDKSPPIPCSLDATGNMTTANNASASWPTRSRSSDSCSRCWCTRKGRCPTAGNAI